MITQLTLPPYTDRYKSIEQRFLDFHAANPHVYAAIVRLAKQLRASGATAGSMKQIFEVLRWEHKLRTNGEEFVLNNSYTPFYSRMVMDQEWGFKGFFETREQKAV